MTAAIWVGNDDYAPTNRMTGGSLPGMIWQQVMAYAHQGVEIKPYPGVAPFSGAPVAAAAPTETTKAADYVPPPQLLTRKGADILVRIEKMLEDATKAMPAPGAPAGPSASPARGRSAEIPQMSGAALAAGESRTNAARN
jgi:penicillin-binding protein 1A